MRFPAYMRMTPYDASFGSIEVERREPKASSAAASEPPKPDGPSPRMRRFIDESRRARQTENARLAVPKPASGLTSDDPAIRAKAMWAADTDNVRGIFDSADNLEADLRHPEPVSACHDNARPGSRPMTALSAECIAERQWAENKNGCRTEFDSYANYLACVMHRCE